ncbi:hypothetical protein FG386_002701 [Cryptosporidium ryanae]|uniref:uncharacterized protein n=1 Tax=Cryptosporidium ryanae TaxID=515981 RepID=UPI00351A1F91|nr:hypothetical protein FG386_002701 [Cryptosporidium ryanae]
MRNGAILCTVCGYTIKDSALLKQHYKSDWHIYNQKRKLSNKEPVTEEVFRRKLELLSTTKCLVEKGNSHIKCRGQTDACTTSNKEDNRVKRATQELPYKPVYCYFDNTIHDTMQDCLEYMRVRYSFVVPDKEYVCDLQGLVTYLGEKVFEGHICLYCDRIFSSLMAVRDHMISLGHTMMGTHLEIQKEEIEQFYDYSSSYKELIPHFGKMSIDSVRDTHYPSKAYSNPDGDGDGDEDEWEYVEEDELLLDDVLDVYNLRKPEITEFGDLRLPNGKEVVHRSVAYIYKQRTHKEVSRQVSPKRPKINDRESNTLNNAGPSTNLPEIKYLNRVNMKQNFLLSSRVKNSKLKTGVNNNKLQKFFVRQDIIW